MPGPRDNLRKAAQAEAFAEYYGAALLEGNAPEAERVVADAIDTGLPEELIRDRVVAASMHRVGRLWEEGAITPAHEHVATQITYRVLALMREAFRVAASRSKARVLLAAVEGERHVVGLQMAADVLEEAGYDVIMLGADVPTESLPAIIADLAPKLVGLSATMRANAVHLPEVVDAVLGADPAIAVIVGGQGVPEVREEAHWIAFTHTVAGVVETADALLRRPSLN